MKIASILQALSVLLLLLVTRAGAALPLFEVVKLDLIYTLPPPQKVWKTEWDPRLRQMKKMRVNYRPTYFFETVPDPENPGKFMRQFVPIMSIQVRTREKITSKGIFAKVYFYDEKRQLITMVPVESSGPGCLPAFLETNPVSELMVPLPKALKDRKWNAVVVFGNSTEATFKFLQAGMDTSSYEFPERKLATRQGAASFEKQVPIVDPIVTLPVITGNTKHPILTMFMRFPKGVTNSSEVKGVLCASVLANSAEQIRDMLLAQEAEAFGDQFSFADEHKLAIIVWGSRRMWTGKNYTEQDKEEIRQAEQDFEEMARAWEKGVKQLCSAHGIPQRNFLLWGLSGAGHWASRLALRRPQYFLAVHTHVSQHFDAPRPEANRMLWLITAGEVDLGYQNTLQFFKDAKKLGYPIIHKGIAGLGHGRNQITDLLGTSFFEYALSLADARNAYDQADPIRPNAPPPSGVPWVPDFRTPYCYGDIVNQATYLPEKAAEIPESFRVPLPTQTIANAWNPKMKSPSEGAAELRPPSAIENLAFRKPFITSDPHPQRNASTGLLDGLWEGPNSQFFTGDSPVFPKTVTIDLQQQARVNMVLLGVPVYTFTKTITVSLSRDGQTFTDISSHVFAKWIEAQHLYHFPPTSARYIRLTFADHYMSTTRAGASGAYRMCVNEVEVYATGEEPTSEAPDNKTQSP